MLLPPLVILPPPPAILLPPPVVTLPPPVVTLPPPVVVTVPPLVMLPARGGRVNSRMTHPWSATCTGGRGRGPLGASSVYSVFGGVGSGVRVGEGEG